MNLPSRNPLRGIRHVAAICSDFECSKRFYVELLGLTVIAENYREQRRSYKLDLAVPDGTQLELYEIAPTLEIAAAP